ncbi:hypothetical protein Y032_0155g3047 [Ancylostoma ceylanicum]|uniref:Uncharacterized protein n=1 Tax=Ancylostoma ceylanicum TaxID=53326 RepID=A0A016SZE3_9BILA|nr:hypothetical protein Y032_0155g3047 [Ancylostoma ceylanicum]
MFFSHINYVSLNGIFSVSFLIIYAVAAVLIIVAIIGIVQSARTQKYADAAETTGTAASSKARKKKPRPQPKRRR